MNSNAKQIWKKGENSENTWMCFVKKLVLDKVPKKAHTKIAVDSKYWLYINGIQTVFEGGIKRGPSKYKTYYDEVDIAAYLHCGENTIAVLVWYFGKSGFSHNSSGMGGLVFESNMGEKIILSDSSWKIKKHPAYVEADKNDRKPNFRLPEPNLYFDAAKDLGEWYSPDYDTSSWDNADVICNVGEETWGSFEKRIIPQFKDFGLKEYKNLVDFKNFTATEETVLKMNLPYNAQLTPYFKITAPAGKSIVIKTENYDTIQPDEKNTMAVYYTTDGVQEYESLGWMNGEQVYYIIPAGVTIHSLKYRETGYDTEFAGSFECDNEFLNTLWQKSLRTLYITMRDTFMDCPDRERVQWWGDVNIEMQMMMYCLDQKALLLYKKGAASLAGWFEDCGYMLTVVPSGTTQYELPFQNLAGIWGFSYYYDYTGDRGVIETVYPMAKSYVLSYPVTADGMAGHKKGSWDWTDWGDNTDVAVMENAWYYMAIQSCQRMAKLLGFNEDIDLYDERMSMIRKNFNRLFLKDGYYYHLTTNEKPDDRANALAVLSGLADEKQYNSILKVLQSTENASPYMEKYVLDALCRMGYVDETLKRMKKRYKEMTEYEYSTLWEYWNTDGTRNHAWSGGPLITMSKYIAGIRPIDSAYSRFEIKPHMGELSFIKCTVPSIKGDIALTIKQLDGRVNMSVTIPENTIAEVYLPLTGNNMLPQNSGYDFSILDGYAKFVFTAGTYNLLAVQ